MLAQSPVGAQPMRTMQRAISQVVDAMLLKVDNSVACFNDYLQEH